MNPLIQLKKANPLFLVAVACFGFLPMAQALLPPPPPDGGYPNGNTAEGTNALFDLNGGTDNTAIGADALLSNSPAASTQLSVLVSPPIVRLSGTATGFEALFSNQTGNYNTAYGYRALYYNNGGDNTAVGTNALFSNTTGGANTATGTNALKINTTGSLNTAVGQTALLTNVSGGSNTAIGYQALLNNTIGSRNTVSGVIALKKNTTGNNNTASGVQALLNNTTGGGNIALGFNAGFNLTTGSNNIDIGNVGVAGEANMIRIGKQETQTGTFVAGIFGSTAASGVGVIVNSSGKLGTVLSSERFKEAIKPMDKASEAIHALKPVTFRYKKEIDPEGVPQFGLVAEEVEKVNPDLVVRDADGEVYTVRYEAVNAMLLNEFLKEHRKVGQLTEDFSPSLQSSKRKLKR